MTRYLSKASLAALEGVHPNLVQVVRRALEIGPNDFRVIEGVRTPERQRALYAQGRTKPGPIVTWTMNSKHFVNKQTGFGHAVDILPAPYDWKNLKDFDDVAKAMFAASKELGIPIRWGGNWDGDEKPREKGEGDNPHFELIM